jgi:hypothetical protein
MSTDEPSTPTQGPPPDDRVPQAPDGWVAPAPPPPSGAWAPPQSDDPQPYAVSYVPQPGYAYGPPSPGSVRPTYEPGLGKLSILPPSQSGWNWGAFLFTWIWGLFNGAYVTLWGLLLWFVPLGNIVWAIVCGVNGNRWAWQGKPWTSAEQFRSVQHKWALAALIFFLVAVVAPLLILLVLSATGRASAVGAAGALPAALL